MVSKVIVMKKFNELLIKFLETVIVAFPGERVLKATKVKLEGLIMASPALCIQTVKGFLMTWEEKIVNKDEDFFLNMEFPEDKNLAFLVDIKNIYKVADDQSKKVIWAYITNLYKLAKKYE